jgi:hypothetical protein
MSAIKPPRKSLLERSSSAVKPPKELWDAKTHPHYPEPVQLTTALPMTGTRRHWYTPPFQSAVDLALEEQRLQGLRNANAVMTPSGPLRFLKDPQDKANQLHDLVNAGILSKKQAAELLPMPSYNTRYNTAVTKNDFEEMVERWQRGQITLRELRNALPVGVKIPYEMKQQRAQKEVELIKDALRTEMTDHIVIWNTVAARNFIRDFERDFKRRIEKFLKRFTQDLNLELIWHHEFNVDVLWSEVHNALYLEIRLLRTRRSEIWEDFCIELKIWAAQPLVEKEPHPLERRRGRTYWSLPNEPKSFLKGS